MKKITFAALACALAAAACHTPEPGIAGEREKAGRGRRPAGVGQHGVAIGEVLGTEPKFAGPPIGLDGPGRATH